VELRCQGNVLFGVVSEGSSGTIEVACKGRWCGKVAGNVVLHTFDLSSGKVLNTKKFRAAEAAFNNEKEAQAQCL
jgi:hypothetical protein